MRTTLRTLALTAALCLAGAAMAQNDSQNVLAAAPADTALTGLKLPASPTVIGEGQMNREQVTNPLEAIDGRVAGLSIQRSNNGMAAMSAVRLRGTTSLTGGNDPLIIVDGVMGDLSLLSGIYPADIESFNIMKDASQTAQYGSRGASGVIEVVTKKGQAGGTRVTYNGSYGFTSVYKNLDMLSAQGYREQCLQRGLMLIDKGFSTNWQKQIERTGFRHDQHVAFSGGGADGGYRVSLGFMDHDGVIVHDNLRNFTSNMSMHQNMFGDLLKIDVGMFGNIQKSKTAIYDVQKTFYSAATWNPTYPARQNADGSYDGFTYANQTNHPLALMDSRTSDKTTHISTHVKLLFNITREFTATVFGAYSHNEVETSQFLPTSIWAHGQAYKGSRKTESLLGNLTLNWGHLFAGSHRLDLMALAEVQRDDLNGFHTTTTNFSTNALGYNSLQAGALTLWEGTGSYKETPTQASFMGRATYDYASRYSLTLTARGDGSSKFGKNNKWGFFPSISGEWNVTNEAFMQGARGWIDQLKLSAGYGLSGNQGGIDNYMSMAVVQPSGVVPVGQSAAVGLETLRNTNPHLKWETKRTFNVGADMAFWGNRVLAAIDWYTAKTVDMLYEYDVSTPPFPFKYLLANIGSMRNSGTEVSLGVTPLVTRDLELNINANLTFQQTKLLSLSGDYEGYHISGPDFKDIASLNGAGFHGGYNHIVYQVVGQPLGVFYLPHCTGLVSDGNGGYTYQIEDLDHDGEINLGNGKDRRVCGQTIPKVLLGSNISLRFKRFDLSLQINGAFGHKIYNGTSLTYMNMNSLPGYNVLAKAPGRNITDQTATDYWLERGDYVNFDYLTLGWDVPLTARVQKVVKQLRLALTVNNLATITGYSGLSPMINNSNVDSTIGVDDKRTYPLSRTCTLAISVSF